MQPTTLLGRSLKADVGRPSPDDWFAKIKMLLRRSVDKMDVIRDLMPQSSGSRLAGSCRRCFVRHQDTDWKGTLVDRGSKASVTFSYRPPKNGRSFFAPPPVNVPTLKTTCVTRS